MVITYKLNEHLRHPHINFAYVNGHHLDDFASHKHDFAELFIVTEGEGSHTVGTHSFPLSQGDVFVIHGDTEHGFSHVKKLKIINLMFENHSPFFEVPAMRKLAGYHAMFKVDPIARKRSEYKAKLTLSASQLEQVLVQTNAIGDEYQAAPIGFELMLTSLMQQLVITLSRFYQGQSDDTPTTTLALSRALIFIEQNYTDVDMSSDKIAKAAYVSRRQLERLFRQFLNTSPGRYLREVQLTHACQLLQASDNRSIQSIAEQCGFSDSNYFSKCFRMTYAKSPRDYAQLHHTR